MATLHPFRALRPDPADVEECACVPYDVVSVAEARALARDKPKSFLHVVRPEIDLPEGTDEHDHQVYTKGAENLAALAVSPEFVHEDAPSLYAYRLVMDGKAQTGVVGCVPVADYDDGRIVRHELTRPDKEDDRTRHLLTQSAHAEPVMLAFRDEPAVARILNETEATEPLYDFVASDGVQHTIWRLADPAALVGAFARVERLYVADGHHRCKAASRAYHALAEKGEATPESEAAFFPAVAFPVSEMRILAYNRVVKRLPNPGGDAGGNGLGPFLAALAGHFDLREDAPPVPERAGDVSLYAGGGRWLGLTLPETRGPGAADRLDVARLGEHVLAPLLGIDDPRTDKNLKYVGGIRGTAELERLVDEGDAALAFSVHPTAVEELLAVSDAGELMPPKSTWFEPKLRSGLLVHLF